MDKNRIIKEINFKAIRSSGPGGQHANKVSSKVVLFFDLKNSKGLNEEEKNNLARKLYVKLTKDGILILKCDESRSQFKNKKLVVNRLMNILTDGTRPIKKRKLTRPSMKSVQKRLQSKKILGIKKVNRKKPNIN